MGSVDITGIDKVELLRALHEGQVTAGFFGGLPGPSFDECRASEAVKQGYIDYFCGRAIKTDISGDSADSFLYNRDAGNGTFEEIVQRLKSKKS
jgi:hypothetical protein